VCHPQLGLPQSGCTSPRALVIEPSGGGGGKRRRRRRVPHHGSHQPRWGAGDSPNGAHLHLSTGRPQGPLAPRTETTPLTSPTSPTLAAPSPPPLTLPSPEAGPSGSGTPPELLSPCGNRVLRRFTRFTTLSGKGRAPGSWDSTAGPSH
jgi:hypothetical protein